YIIPDTQHAVRLGRPLQSERRETTTRRADLTYTPRKYVLTKGGSIEGNIKNAAEYAYTRGRTASVTAEIDLIVDQVAYWDYDYVDLYVDYIGFIDGSDYTQSLIAAASTTKSYPAPGGTYTGVGSDVYDLVGADLEPLSMFAPQFNEAFDYLHLEAILYHYVARFQVTDYDDDGTTWITNGSWTNGEYSAFPHGHSDPSWRS
ncbi:MAG TPA: hypothetical protein VKT77_07620, partial [Chthonomonadaceae bacterium]|nr:hypothetical protein [Chthonomonadaceae bacterium]